MSERILMSERTLHLFYEKVVVDLATGCWLWKAHTDADGYGSFWCPAKKQMRDAHRVAYEHFVGEVPTGMTLGHLEQTDKCAFFEHVRPITYGQNVREGLRYQSSEVHCKRGHPRIPAFQYKGKNGCTSCSACTRLNTLIRNGYESRACFGCGYVKKNCRCAQLWP